MQVATKRAAMDPITGLIDMDVLTTGRTQASRLMIGRLITLLKDIVRANLNDFRGNGMRFYDLLNKVHHHIHYFNSSMTISIKRMKLNRVVMRIETNNQTTKMNWGRLSSLSRRNSLWCWWGTRIDQEFELGTLQWPDFIFSLFLFLNLLYWL